MLQTWRYWFFYGSFFIVSSPQGNATNCFLQVFVIFFFRCFKSPRECYKRWRDMENRRIEGLVSSPQGNATNLRQLIRSSGNNTGVSSPQGNATNLLPLTTTTTVSLCFKSPRECYKLTHPFLLKYRLSCCFKSPRECYKRRSTKWRRTRKYKFQVPKGMLQTRNAGERWMGIENVSSPQGNATNAKPVTNVIGYIISFKSPRECYKLSGETSKE